MHAAAHRPPPYHLLLPINACYHARPAAQIFAVLQWDSKDGLSAEKVAEKKADLDFAAVVKVGPERQTMAHSGCSGRAAGHTIS